MRGANGNAARNCSAPAGAPPRRLTIPPSAVVVSPAMATIAGLLLIAGGMIAAGLLVVRRRPVREWASFAAIGAAAGSALVLVDRFAEPETPAGPGASFVAEIRAAAERAGAEADRIETLRRRLEGEPPRAAPAQAPAPTRAAVDANRLGDDASRRLRDVDDALKSADTALASLRDITELMQLVVAARGDDRHAFDRLCRFAKDSSYRYRDAAASVRRGVVQEHAKEIVVDGSRVAWRPGVDPRRVSSPELKGAFQDLPPEHKPAFLDFISQRRDLTRRQRMAFFADVLQRDGSLHVVECAGRYFANEAGLEPHPLGVGFYLDWWASNERSIRD